MDVIEPTSLQRIWDWMLDTLGHTYFEFPLHFMPVVVAVVGITGIAFSILDVRRRRVAAGVAILNGTRIMSGYIVAAGLLLTFHYETRWITVDVPDRAPGWPSFCAQVAIFTVLGELLTYWWHRLEHGSRFVFERVHFLHHHVANPLTVWTNFVVHPVEGLMVLVCLYGPLIAVGAHPLVFFAYAIVNTTAMVITHSGYDFRLWPAWLFPRASGHELHHSERRPTNLSVVMSYGDRLFGTYVEP